MTEEIKMAAQRLIIARLIMKLGRKATMAYLAADETFENVADMVLAKAVFIAQLEGRPLTAAKIAAHVGMPRTTVARRMDALVRSGVVLRDDAGRFTLPAERMNSPEVLANLRRIIAAVTAAAAELAKMGAADVAGDGENRD